MKKILLLIGIILITSCSKENTVEEVGEFEVCEQYLANEAIEYTEEMADPETGLIEGDIIPDRSYIEGKAVLIKGHDRSWSKEDGEIILPYFYRKRSVDENNIVTVGFRQSHIDTIEMYMDTIRATTNLNPVRFEDEKALKKVYRDGAVIEPGFGASSAHVGRMGGIQPIKIAYSWEDIPHEVGHTVRFEHEHNHPFRNDQIIIHKDNIIPRYLDQFIVKETSMYCGNEGIDFKNNMIYPSNMPRIAVNPKKPVMTKIDGSIWGRNIWFSEKQKEVIRIMSSK